MWIVKHQDRDGTLIYWNEDRSEWSYSRDKATEFVHYVDAELVSDQEGGWVDECKAKNVTITEQPELGSSTK